jgi:hypothetical protein
LLFGGPSRREGERGEIGVVRIEYSRTERQHCEEYGDDKRSLVTFHGESLLVEKRADIQVQPFLIRNSYVRQNVIPRGSHRHTPACFGKCFNT